MSRHKKIKAKASKFMQPGFTIVELLIVIVIIGILASLTIAAYNGVQERSKYSKIRDGIVKVEKAFRAKAILDGRYQQDQYYLTCVGEPLDPAANLDLLTTISLCDDTNPLKQYLRAEDYPYDPFQEMTWAYDNDNDTYPHNCTEADRTKGVNLLMPFLGTSNVQRLDTDIDQGDGRLCGKVRWSASNTGYGFYLLANHFSDGL